ncbi:MAG: hypothetical protein D6796_07225 [Caldilineae bacterium]|nr:MAG: hypothetical protein D6796_07225 [Caldilineae bacterium]
MKSKLATIFFLLLGLAISLGGYRWIRARLPALEELPAVRRTLTAPATPGTPPPLTSGEAATTAVNLSEYRKPAFFFLLMLAGILANQIYERAKYLQARGRKTITLGSLFGAIQSNPRFWMALSISPFIFFTTYSYIAELPDGPVAMFYAFQNGFFWQAVFGGFEKK